ncbi:hypothetical protein FDI24_gp203 [Acidovorax phage ACP17]|uniref:Glycine zipper 2TM domain-containing protein n=1 Tax=Acidovorax phage ACP17 TaxID=2010329 RepID=A0A218M357_9CAUD|nr:hypothetical protein FDI24_gp203 [Acidovorax phage ACP17]ASD50484.1 hypothetical protein [Acidovorax phage ACP17]
MNGYKGMLCAALLAACASAAAQDSGVLITRKAAGTVIASTPRAEQKVCADGGVNGAHVAGGLLGGAAGAGAAKFFRLGKTATVISGLAGGAAGTMIGNQVSKDCKTVPAGHDISVEFADKSEVLVNSSAPRVVGSSAVVLFYSNGTFGLR